MIRFCPRVGRVDLKDIAFTIVSATDIMSLSSIGGMMRTSGFVVTMGRYDDKDELEFKKPLDRCHPLITHRHKK